MIVIEALVRPAQLEDERFLWLMLFYASRAYEQSVLPEHVATTPALVRYVHGWGRTGDLGFVAESGGQAVGAAWLRLLVGEERQTVAYVGDTTPELAVALLPGYEGGGIGTLLLRTLFAGAAAHYPAVTLTVRLDNPALRLYERLGFETREIVTNRVGTDSAKMLLRLHDRDQEDDYRTIGR
jgi:ribosomal protein S18 acetylase RimI-like enzyme